MQAGIRRTATVAAARDAFSTPDSVAELKNCNMSIISTNRTVSSLVE
jgi:protein-tyrosine phosphatase